MDQLEAILRQEIADYSGPSLKSTTHYIEDMNRQIYAVVIVPDLPRPFKSRVMVMARIIGNFVIIDEDTTDRPLYETLIKAGIPREKIILLYAGEQLPDTTLEGK